MINLVVIIPTYNPQIPLKNLINFFINKEVDKIIIVNDGSKTEYLKNISMLKNDKLVYLSNKTNNGKGASIKLALNYIETELVIKNFYILHCDDDYQHTFKSINKIIDKATNSTNYDKFLIGQRAINFKAPLFSYIGNIFINKILRKKLNIKNIDTQSGLRMYPKDYVKFFSKLESNRFEFETEMLIKLTELKKEILKVDIETKYIKKHYTRYRKILDSLLFLNLLKKNLLKK